MRKIRLAEMDVVRRMRVMRSLERLAMAGCIAACACSCGGTVSRDQRNDVRRQGNAVDAARGSGQGSAIDASREGGWGSAVDAAPDRRQGSPVDAASDSRQGSPVDATRASDASTSADGAATPVKCEVRVGPDPAVPDGCPELRERLVVTDPIVEDEDGDGRFAPGDRLRVTVSLTDRSGYGFNDYPGLDLDSVDPSGHSEQIGGNQFYAVLPCQSMPVTGSLTLSKDIPRGATIRVVARVTALSGCEGADTLVVPIVVD
jgi:hypothetical protein